METSEERPKKTTGEKVTDDEKATDDGKVTDNEKVIDEDKAPTEISNEPSKIETLLTKKNYWMESRLLLKSQMNHQRWKRLTKDL